MSLSYNFHFVTKTTFVTRRLKKLNFNKSLKVQKFSPKTAHTRWYKKTFNIPRRRKRHHQPHIFAWSHRSSTIFPSIRSTRQVGEAQTMLPFRYLFPTIRSSLVRWFQTNTRKTVPVSNEKRKSNNYCYVHIALGQLYYDIRG